MDVDEGSDQNLVSKLCRISIRGFCAYAINTEISCTRLYIVCVISYTVKPQKFELQFFEILTYSKSNQDTLDQENRAYS